MRQPGAAATFVVAALFCAPCSAQQGPVGAADSSRSARPARKHVITVRPVFRRYSVDTTTVTEQTGSVEYALSEGRVRVRVSGEPLRFSDGVTAISGATPAQLTLDVRVGRMDTVRISARTPSTPSSLTATQTAVLGSVGTGTLDLESIALGTPAAGGARVAVARAVGAVIVGFRGGVEVEPRPGAGNSVYWRGTTVRAGGSVTGFAGEFRITGGLDVAKSFSDSLGGRNLFPGGGSFALRADAAGLVGTNATLANFSAFYFRPLALNRPIQANRLIPTGDFAGASASLLVPAGRLFVLPSLSVTRESSKAAETFLGQQLTLEGSGLAVSGSLGVDVPVGRHLSFTPEAGFVGGTVRSDLFLTSTGARGISVTVPAAVFFAACPAINDCTYSLC